ncbi:radical SAM protein [candidate division KSB1 bacterium]|nr:radical SAM protein [candidate division KSB1 bacterium]
MSLGVDLMAHKTCSLNCVYCECGRTTNLTTKRKKYIPLKSVLNELRQFLSSKPELDYITFSGSGEPTLHSGIGEVIRFLKDNYPQYKIALLTNGTLLTDARLRDDVKSVDLILPSLDAASAEIFKKINRPAKRLKIDQIIEGLAAFRQQFSGKMLLEIFIIPGLNDTADELALLKAAIHRIKPDEVQLNTLDRPGTESWVESAKLAALQKIAQQLDWKTEIIANFRKRHEIASYHTDTEESILQMIKRRPCTVDDLSVALGLHSAEINKYLEELLESNRIQAEKMERGVFFKLSRHEPN